MKLLVFAGSTRQNSWNRKLAKVVAAMARSAGAEVTHLELADFDVPMYNADLEAKGTPADVMKLKQLFYEHPAWIICSPEYNASYPALLEEHAGLDVQPGEDRPGLERRFPLQPRQGGRRPERLARRLGGLRSQSHLVPLLFNLHCWVAPQTFALGRAATAFDGRRPAGRREDCATHPGRDRPSAVGRSAIGQRAAALVVCATWPKARVRFRWVQGNESATSGY